MHRVDSEIAGNRNNKRHKNNNGRKNINQTPDNKQKNIKTQQKRKAVGREVVAQKREHLHRHLRVNKVIGKSERGAENHQNRADKEHAFNRYPKEVAAKMYLAPDSHFNYSDIKRRQGCKLVNRKKSRVKPDNQKNRKRKLPDNGTRGNIKLAARKTVARMIRAA